MNARFVGLIIIAAGLCAVVIGVLVAVGAMSWFGRLPGDIRIENDGTRIYIPLTSMLLVSAALTVIVNLVRRLL
jgi:hypothetical protein